jgi:hypothetical protein
VKRRRLDPPISSGKWEQLSCPGCGKLVLAFRLPLSEPMPEAGELLHQIPLCRWIVEKLG